jgi:3-methyl-2-oxobutanoate hydroxymethyltransferase
VGGRVTIPSAADLKAAKGQRRLAVLTAYDYPTALALDAAGLDILLVGDSLGEVELGFASTRDVTLTMMEHHVRAVANGATDTHICGDLPAGTYRTAGEAVDSARALVAAGANSVKLEGALIPQVEAIIADGTPVMGHVGLLPQTAEGGYRRQGTTREDAARIIADAIALDAAGCFAIVIEAVDPAVATAITPQVSAPTIGIAAGADCDGQVLVSTDLLGLLPSPPPFVTPKANLHATITEAARAFARDVREAS